jgi:hypothetical protein
MRWRPSIEWGWRWRRTVSSASEKRKPEVKKLSYSGDRLYSMEAERVHESTMSSIEKKTLIWLAQRMPAWVNPDHLTDDGGVIGRRTRSVSFSQ